MIMKSTCSPHWESLIKRLTAVAFGWFYDRRCSDDESVLPGTGVSARDLAYNAILEFLKNEGQYNPTSDEDRFRLIYTIMKRDFIDLVRKDGLMTERSFWTQRSMLMVEMNLRIYPIRETISLMLRRRR